MGGKRRKGRKGARVGKGVRDMGVGWGKGQGKD